MTLLTATRLAATAVLVPPVAAPALAAPAGGAVVIVDTDDAAPGGDGNFRGFGQAVLNDLGQTAFVAGVTNGNGGIFRADGTSLASIALQGQPAPDGNGSFRGFNGGHTLNDAGQVAFFGELDGTAGGLDDAAGIFRGDGATLTQIARRDQPAPDADGGTDGVLRWLYPPAINGAGQVAFQVSHDFSLPRDDFGLYRGDGGALELIGRVGQAAPDGDGTISRIFGPVSLNDAGEAAFNTFLAGTSGGADNVTAIFRGDGTTLVQVARNGQAATDGETFRSVDLPVLNDAGQVAFEGFTERTDGGLFNGNSGIYRDDGGALTRIARTGEVVPGGDATFSLFAGHLLNDAGQVAFRSYLNDADDGQGTGEGIFLGDGTSLVQVLRYGQPAPDGDGGADGMLFAEDFALNNRGQIAFDGLIDTGVVVGGFPVLESGVFFYDDAVGLVPVAREGDEFDGSTITGVSFAADLASGEQGSGLNDLGQVAYTYGLADGRRGVAIWTVPEPGAAGMFLSAFGLAALRRRRA